MSSFCLDNATWSVPSEGILRVAAPVGFPTSVGELVLESGEVGLFEVGGVCAKAGSVPSVGDTA